MPHYTITSLKFPCKSLHNQGYGYRHLIATVLIEAGLKMTGQEVSIGYKSLASVYYVKRREVDSGTWKLKLAVRTEENELKVSRRVNCLDSGEVTDVLSTSGIL